MLGLNRPDDFSEENCPFLAFTKQVTDGRNSGWTIPFGLTNERTHPHIYRCEDASIKVKFRILSSHRKLKELLLICVTAFEFGKNTDINEKKSEKWENGK